MTGFEPSKSDFRNAMARLGAAVNVITTDGPAGRAGFTASAVCSVTDEPPSLLVCLNRSASVYETFKANGVLCVNVLGAGHQAISNLFGGKTPMAERFAAARWTLGPSGSPILQEASVSFDCRLSQITEVGTHDVLVCEVMAITTSEQAQSLIYFNRQYHELQASA
ncbi:FMN reductase [Pseudomonas sp. Leaf127]|uniref:NADH-dependent FMN reductase RutF n=1 Tax=Pseudomonas sp. Leaf127 TaxID=1736267 RepID=UPI0007036288|nr:pyrimidine utilization flavin reductase protein F [Pseudomonas sp. Leaf127]KQQ62430.1 FMN reductase [Pseudomonas sp. Leaf127]